MMTESSSSTSIAGKLVGGADPKALEPTKRDADGLKIVTPTAARDSISAWRRCIVVRLSRNLIPFSVNRT
jgi:hypothetical protein